MTVELFILDLIRVIFFVSCSAILGMSLIVSTSYAKAYRRHRRRIKAGEEEEWKRLLPLHVTVIAGSHLGLVMMSVFEVSSRLDWDSIHWRTPVLTVLNVTGAYALYVILRHGKHQRREHVVTRLSKDG